MNTSAGFRCESSSANACPGIFLEKDTESALSSGIAVTDLDDLLSRDHLSFLKIGEQPSD